MSPENKDLQILVSNGVAAQTLLTWLAIHQQEANESYERLSVGAAFDDSKVAHMRVAYGYVKAITDLYSELKELSENTGA